MLKIDIDTKSLFKLAANIKAYQTQKVQEIKDVVNEAALNIQREAKANLTRGGQVDTGNLRSRIVIEPATTDRLTLRVGTNVFYGIYIEFGTGIYAVNGDGRKTPWLIPVPIDELGTGKKKYNWKIVEIDGQQFYFTRGAKPHPFLFPAFENERNKFKQRIEEVLKNA